MDVCKKLWKNVKKYSEFSISITIVKVLIFIAEKALHNNRIIYKLYKVKDNLIENEICDCIMRDKWMCRRMNKVEHYKVWIYWAQGWDNPPDNVKRDLASVKKNISWADIICIDDMNFDKYIHIPDFIIKKRNEGKISTTHFSDILRVYLLAEYGGLWLDASAFILWPITFEELNHCFFTIRTSKDITMGRCISRSRWSIGFMGTSYRYYLLFEVMKNMINDYWTKYDYVVDYFITDYMVDIILSKNNILLKDYMSGVVTYDGTYELVNIVNTLDTSKLNIEIYRKTKIYYLPWRKKYKETINGEKTIYSKILDIIGD